MKILLPVLLIFLPAQLWAEKTITLTADAGWHDNITNADRAADIVTAGEIRSQLNAMWHYRPIARHTFQLGGIALVEHWPRYEGLRRAGLGITLGWQYKPGLGPYAPVFALEGEATAEQVRESDRNGRAGTIRFVYRRRLAPDWRLQVQQDFARYDGRNHAFDRTGRETTLSVHRDFGGDWVLTAEMGYRSGEVLSYATPPRPDLFKESRALATVTTFGRTRPMVAYSFPADTCSGRLALTRALSSKTALTLSTEHRETRNDRVSYLNWSHHLLLITKF